jgi:hypothetical protein
MNRSICWSLLLGLTWMLATPACGPAGPELPTSSPIASPSSSPEAAPASSPMLSPGASPPASSPEAPPASTSGASPAQPPPPPPTSLWVFPRTDGRPGLQGARPGDWTTLMHPGYEYGCEVPATWIQSSPENLNRDRARMLWPPGQTDVRVVLFPFGIYDRPADDELRIAEAVWLLNDARVVKDTLLEEKEMKVGERQARRVRRLYTLKDDDRTFLVVTTFVVARPKAFVVALLGPKDLATRYLSDYERMVRTFVAWNPEQTPAPFPTALPGSSLPPPPEFRQPDGGSGHASRPPAGPPR